MNKKTHTQRTMALFLIVCMILSYGSFGIVNAADVPIGIALSNGETTVGGSTTINVVVDPNSNVGALTFVINFDPAKVEFETCTPSALLAGGFSDFNATAGQVKVSYINMTPVTAGGTFFQLTFKGVEGSEATDITLTADEFVTTTGGAIPNTVTDATIKVDSPLNGITIKSETTIPTGGFEDLIITYDPDTTTDPKTATWATNDPSIATVNQDGRVTAINPGTATITVTVGDFTKTCAVTVNEVPKPLAGISVKSSTTLEKGAKETLAVTYNPTNPISKGVLTWSTSDANIASVNATTGEVTAVNNGSAVITATVVVDGIATPFTDTCNVIVNIPLKGISLDKISGTLAIGGTSTDQLTVIYSPVDTTDDKTITWTSSNTDVATVSNAGLVTAAGPGNATITATVGTFTAEYEATVTVPLKSIALNKSIGTLLKDATDKLVVAYDPNNTTDNKTVTWTSSNAAVATVDNQGNVKAIKEGTATITATVGAFNATCDYTVTEIHMTEVKFDQTAGEIQVGKSITLVPVILPATTTDDKTFTWTSSDENVATVDSSGKVMVKATTGTAIITATSNANNTLKATFTVTAVPIPLDSIGLSSDTLTLVEGNSSTLTVIYNPADTTDDKTVTWTSSDVKVATVDKDGKVTAVKAGTATITAQVGEKTATSVVTVQAAGSVVDPGTTTTTTTTTKTQSGNNPKTGVTDEVSGLIVAAFGIAFLGGAMLIKRKQKA